MGLKSVKFQGNDVIVGYVVFKGTPGYFELFFSKSPIYYTAEDKIT